MSEHGHSDHILYGDDGEMACNSCLIDFKRDPPDLIEQKLHAWNLKHYDHAAVKAFLDRALGET